LSAIGQDERLPKQTWIIRERRLRRRVFVIFAHVRTEGHVPAPRTFDMSVTGAAIRSTMRCAAAIVALSLVVLPSQAEPTVPAYSLPPSWVLAQAPPQPTPRPQPQPKAAKKETPSGGGSIEAQLRQRVEQLEEQLVDMQVLVGTLESLARGGGGAPRAGGGSGASETARIDVLETQVRAMTSQIEQLSQQLRQQSGRRDDGFSPPVAQPQSAPGFGSVTVTPQSSRDPIGQIISADPARSAPPAGLPPAIAESGSAKELYETAYGYLLQQDYGAAEAAFEEFLRRYPDDRLTADAQYWMGETLFVQRRYKPAGQAFLKVIQSHRQSSKTPNSLLMLAMTLEQLGQKDCALFSELETKHPNASADIKGRARVVKQRVGC
jgi:tol-pal system protein YbgF